MGLAKELRAIAEAAEEKYRKDFIEKEFKRITDTCRELANQCNYEYSYAYHNKPDSDVVAKLEEEGFTVTWESEDVKGGYYSDEEAKTFVYTITIKW